MFAAGAEIVGRLIAGLTSRLGGLISIAEKVASVIAKVIPGSPVEEGPLRVLNRGHAGKQIIQMLIDGIEARRSDLAAAMRNVSLSVPTEVLGTSAALSGSASRTSTRDSFAVAQPAGVDPRDIAGAVKDGLTGSKFVVDRDGVGRIVADSLIPGFVMGGI
jgi:hypothetical protein